jgi:hypothetical protein
MDFIIFLRFFAMNVLLLSSRKIHAFDAACFFILYVRLIYHNKHHDFIFQKLVGGISVLPTGGRKAERDAKAKNESQNDTLNGKINISLLFKICILSFINYFYYYYKSRK